jgi:hypothetical protein
MLAISGPVLNESTILKPPSTGVNERIPCGLATHYRVKGTGIEKIAIGAKLHRNVNEANYLFIRAFCLPSPMTNQALSQLGARNRSVTRFGRAYAYQSERTGKQEGLQSQFHRV